MAPIASAPTKASVRKLAQLCAELGRFIGDAEASCAVAWDSSAQPRIVAVSGNVQSVLQVPAETLVGLPAAAIFAGGERAARDLAGPGSTATLTETRQLLRGVPPQQFPAQLLLRLAPSGVVALIRDLSVSQQQGDAVQRADDLARFASLVAHEVRNPLSAVKIALQTLERHGTLGTNDLRRTSIALREVLNIELLLNEVLEFARPPTLSLVPGDPRSLISEAVQGVEAEWATRGVTFATKVPERFGPVQCDPVRVRTLARILCRQAAVAAEEAGGGLVQVSLRELPGRFWELSVIDPGRTLPPELREKAFVPFTPNRARGSGLGLAVVERIAREHRGSARLDEGPTGGNAITVTFADER